MGDISKACPMSTQCLVIDFLHYKLNRKGYKWDTQPLAPKPTAVMKAIRQIGDEFEVKNRSEFDDMFSNLNITPETAEETFVGVINELFSEGVTWGRLVAMFAFGGEMAVQSVDKGMTVLLAPLAEWMVAYIDETLINWINDHGGWDGFMNFCKFGEGKEDSSPDLKKIVCGLAVGVIGALTVGAFLNRIVRCN